MIGSARTSRYDLAVVEAARLGDERALITLIAAAQPDIRRYASRNCRMADADDVVQETLLVLYRHLGSLRAVTSFAGWLLAVAHRACLRLLRVDATMSGHLTDEIEMRIAHLRPEDLRIDLGRAIQSLPDHYREVILLRDIEEMTIDEIASALALTRESIKARLHRARAMIREYLIDD